MNNKIFLFIISALFDLIALIHIVRVWRGWEVTIGDVAIPIWASWIAIVVAILIAYWAYRLRKVH